MYFVTEPSTDSQSSIDRFIFLVTIAVLGLLLLIALAVILFLFMRIRFFTASQKQNTDSVQMNGLSKSYSSEDNNYLDPPQQWREREMQNGGFQYMDKYRVNESGYSDGQYRAWKDKPNEEFDYSFGEISSSVVI